MFVNGCDHLLYIWMDGYGHVKNDKQSYLIKNIRERSLSNEHSLIESSLSFWFY